MAAAATTPAHSALRRRDPMSEAMSLHTAGSGAGWERMVRVGCLLAGAGPDGAASVAAHGYGRAWWRPVPLDEVVRGTWTSVDQLRKRLAKRPIRGMRVPSKIPPTAKSVGGYGWNRRLTASVSASNSSTSNGVRRTATRAW